MAVFRAAMVLSGLFFSSYNAWGKECSQDEVGMVMMSCQSERKSLSTASNQNDTSTLCRALQKYSECIGPQIAKCKGQDMLAFNVIKTKYAAAPYHCHVIDTWTQGNVVDQQVENSEEKQHKNANSHSLTQTPLDDLSSVNSQKQKSKDSSMPPPAVTVDMPHEVSNTSSMGLPSTGISHNYRQPWLDRLIFALVTATAILFC